MTDEQIMQGLKWCYQVEGSCGDCPYRPDDIKKAKCHDRLGNDVIGLIERQQAEIERLNSCVMSEEQVREIMKSQMHTVFKDIIEDATDKAIKEFAERVKDICRPFPMYDDYECNTIYEKDIDNLVKEMIGEEK